MRGKVGAIGLVFATACGGAAKPPCHGLCTLASLTELDILAGQPSGPGLVDGAGAAAHFALPWALSGDGAGHLYVSDGEVIRAADLSTGAVTTLAGAYGMIGGNDGAGPDARFYDPGGLAATASALFLADEENNTIRKIDLASDTVSTYAGVYEVGDSTDGPLSVARFREVQGLALLGDDLYVSDTDNQTLRHIAISTGTVTTIAGVVGMVGTTDGASSDARFNQPKAIALDGNGNLFILDSGNARVRKLVLASSTISTVATFDTTPSGMTTDGTDLLVSLGNEIVRVSVANGSMTVVVGSESGDGFIDGVGADARFTRPIGLWNDGAGNLYVADSGNYVIRKVALTTGTVSTFAGANSTGTADGTATDARFRTPQGMIATADGNLYVADTLNHTLRKVSLATGEVSTFAGAAGHAGLLDGMGASARFNQPAGLALDGESQLYVADAGNRAIRRIDLTTGAVATVSLKSGGMLAALSFPTAIALSGNQLFITDSGRHIILSANLDSLEVTTLAGGEMQTGGVDGVGTAARFNTPIGMAADGKGNLYVADVLNYSVRKISIASGQVTTFAGELGVRGTADGNGSDARFGYPTELAIDAIGDLFVTDSLNNTVRHISTGSGQVTTAVGTVGLSGVKPGPLPSQITQPSAIAITYAGALAIASENAILIARAQEKQ